MHNFLKIMIAFTSFAELAKPQNRMSKMFKLLEFRTMFDRSDMDSKQTIPIATAPKNN